MDILKIAFKFAPDESKMLSQIYKEDRRLNTLAKKINKKIIYNDYSSNSSKRW